MQETWPFSKFMGISRFTVDSIRSYFATAIRSNTRHCVSEMTYSRFPMIGAAQFDTLNTKAEMLNERLPAYFDGRDSRPLLFIGLPKSFLDLRIWLQDQGQPVDHYNDLSDAIRDLWAEKDRWSFVIVQVDDFGGIATAIEALLLLRNASGDCPVILLSADVTSDDLTTERLTLCDATLRLPLSVPRFEVGIAEAGINNGVWHDRKFQLRPTG